MVTFAREQMSTAHITARASAMIFLAKALAGTRIIGNLASHVMPSYANRLSYSATARHKKGRP